LAALQVALQLAVLAALVVDYAHAAVRLVEVEAVDDAAQAQVRAGQRHLGVGRPQAGRVAVAGSRPEAERQLGVGALARVGLARQSEHLDRHASRALQLRLPRQRRRYGPLELPALGHPPTRRLDHLVQARLVVLGQGAAALQLGERVL